MTDQLPTSPPTSTDYLTGPSTPTETTPTSEWGAHQPVAPAAAPENNQVDDVPPVSKKRIFSRSFVMLLGAMALAGVTAIGAMALSSGDESTLANAPLGGLTTFVTDQTDDTLSLDIDYSEDDDMTASETRVAAGRIDQDQEDLAALLKHLGFSSAVMNRMGNTRALDGTQNAETDGVSVYWTYHPDSGQSIVFERSNK